MGDGAGMPKQIIFQLFGAYDWQW